MITVIVPRHDEMSLSGESRGLCAGLMIDRARIILSFYIPYLSYRFQCVIYGIVLL